MRNSLVIFENHFDEKTTLVFQHNNEKFIINGCQTFLETQKEAVFEQFNVGQAHREDVNSALSNLSADCSENDLIKILYFYPLFLEEIEEPTPKMCMTAVQEDGAALEYVKEQTPEICLAAVQQYGWALQYVKEQTPEICLAAVQQYGDALGFVKEQTPEICLEAVKQDGDALGFVKEQTPEICLAAVRQDGRVLQYVKEKTPEIIDTAEAQIASQTVV